MRCALFVYGNIHNVFNADMFVVCVPRYEKVYVFHMFAFLEITLRMYGDSTESKAKFKHRFHLTLIYYSFFVITLDRYLI